MVRFVILCVIMLRVVTLCVFALGVNNADDRFVEFHYDVINQNALILLVILLSVVPLSVIILIAFMLTVIMLCHQATLNYFE